MAAGARPNGVRAISTSQMTAVELAKCWAQHFGYYGGTGGWIYRPQDDKNVVQGWELFAEILQQRGYIEVGVGIHWRTERGPVENPKIPQHISRETMSILTRQMDNRRRAAERAK